MLGQVLPTTAGASYTIVSDAVVELQAKRARLIAERDSLAALTFPADLAARAAQPSVAAILASERRLFALHATAADDAGGQASALGQAAQKPVSGNKHPDASDTDGYAAAKCYGDGYCNTNRNVD